LLLFKSGRYERVIRQGVASPVLHVLVTTRWMVFYLWQWQWLPSPEKQQLLKRAGRLYKNSRWPSKEERCLFDKCFGKRVSWVDGRCIESDAVEEQARIEWREKARIGGEVIHLGPPAERYARLERDRASYNTAH